MKDFLFTSFYCTLIFVLVNNILCSEVIRPRGVPLSKKVFYDPSKDFTCIDGSLTIPFKRVNDDYCDCPDGSDEPGTSACPNGVFHCSNVGFVEKDIFSSFVNDGICDCCDGSDEWLSKVNCVNNCLELGEANREAQKKEQEIFRQGNEIRNGYINEAINKKQGIQKQLDQLREELSNLESEKEAKNQLKEQTNQLEKDALDKHNAKLEELKKVFEENEAKKNKEKERKLALIAFNELDVNGNGVLEHTDLLKFNKLDQNADGIVTDEEVKFFLNNQDSMSLEEFLEIGWPLIKPFYTKEEPIHVDTNKHEKEESLDNVEEKFNSDNLENNNNLNTNHENLDVNNENLDSNNDHEHENNQADDYNEENFDHEETKEDYSTKSEENSEPELEYDEETKQIMEKAKEYRNQYSEIEQRYLTIQSKINELENSLTVDYGIDNEFLPLHGHCFEYTDREYTYKLCPFDMASQRPKDGHGETNLGRWGHWNGPESKKYSSFKFEGGATCWNGPPRSVEVSLSCGVENKITAASEPSRCEYKFDFETPARCIVKNNSNVPHTHTEL